MTDFITLTTAAYLSLFTANIDQSLSLNSSILNKSPHYFTERLNSAAFNLNDSNTHEKKLISPKVDRWLLPIGVTIISGATVYAFYSLRTR